MILGWWLRLTLGLLAPDDLAGARAALARGDYATSEALALAAARPPQAGAALELAGLARFRDGRPAQALEAFDAAGRAADAPERGRWQYNRAACLYELGRFAEAERAFVEAADLDPALAGAALANAGFAALDRGDAARAAELAGRARSLAAGAVATLLADLQARLADAAEPPARREAAAEHRAGLEAYDAGRFDEALSRFRRAVALDPSAGRHLIMAGAAARQLGRRAEAREALEAALALPLAPDEARIAYEHLDALGGGPGGVGPGWHAAARAGGGFDGNVTQSASGAAEVGPLGVGRVASALLQGGLSLAHGWRAGALAVELAYGVDQLAYADPAAADYSLQQHALGASARWGIGPLRLGASVGGLLAFTGLSDFRGLQAGVGAGAWLALEQGSLATLRLEYGFARRASLRAEFDHLAGDRLDVALGEVLRLGPLALELGYRFRDEGLGTLQQATQLALPAGTCDFGCAQTYVVPFGYEGHALLLSARLPVGRRVAVALAGGHEWRTYYADSRLVLTYADGTSAELDRLHRRDERLWGELGVTVRAAPGLDLALRYELVWNRSNVQSGGGDLAACAAPTYVCHALDYDDKNCVKHVVTLEATYGR